MCSGAALCLLRINLGKAWIRTAALKCVWIKFKWELKFKCKTQRRVPSFNTMARYEIYIRQEASSINSLTASVVWGGSPEQDARGVMRPKKILFQWVWWLNLVYLSLCNHLQPAPQTPPLSGMLCQSSGLLCYLLHLMAKLHWPLCSIWAQLWRHKSDRGDYIHMLHYLHCSRALVFHLYLLCHILFIYFISLFNYFVFIYLFIFMIGHIIRLGHAPETGNIQNTKRCTHTHTHTHTNTDTHTQTQADTVLFFCINTKHFLTKTCPADRQPLLPYMANDRAMDAR